MFQPETEDMLPRAAPKPSATLPADEPPTVKTSVPEVSMLFGQEALPTTATKTLSTTTTTTATTKAAAQPISFSDWKKKSLPKVIYPPNHKGKINGKTTTTTIGFENGPLKAFGNQTTNFATNGSVAATNNYPTNTMAVIAPNTNSAFTAINTNLAYMPTATSTAPNFDVIQTQPRSLESAATSTANMCHYTTATATNANNMQRLYQQHQQFAQQQQQQQQWQQQQLQQQQRCSLDAHLTAVVSCEKLTICASTQTDNHWPTTAATTFNLNELVDKFANKEDIKNLLTEMLEMREEQKRLMQICETLLLQQKRNAEKEQRTTTQNYNDVEQHNSSLNSVRNHIPNSVQKSNAKNNEENWPPQTLAPTTPTTSTQTQATNQFNALIQYQTPRLSPNAQSTAYHSNSPRLQQQQQQQQQQIHNYNNILPKATTEKSIVMNKLALKYLPNDQLNEMLQDLDISTALETATAPIIATPPTAVPTPTLPYVQPLRCIDNFDKTPTDMSNASYKYLKKYRLLPEETAATTTASAPKIYGPNYQQFESQQLRFNLEQRRSRSPLNCEGRQNKQMSAQNDPLYDLEQIRQQPKLF